MLPPRQCRHIRDRENEHRRGHVIHGPLPRLHTGPRPRRPHGQASRRNAATRATRPLSHSSTSCAGHRRTRAPSGAGGETCPPRYRGISDSCADRHAAPPRAGATSGSPNTATPPAPRVATERKRPGRAASAWFHATRCSTRATRPAHASGKGRLGSSHRTEGKANAAPIA